MTKMAAYRVRFFSWFFWRKYFLNPNIGPRLDSFRTTAITRTTASSTRSAGSGSRSAGSAPPSFWRCTCRRHSSSSSPGGQLPNFYFLYLYYIYPYILFYIFIYIFTKFLFKMIYLYFTLCLLFLFYVIVIYIFLHFMVVKLWSSILAEKNVFVPNSMKI
jgi:prepilin signal peptidase PulO-like enzyme (type II secretory pathway)